MTRSGGLLRPTWLLCVGTLMAALASAPAQAQPVLHYQGRLLDPTSGAPRADGTYSMLFALYTQESGGAPFWTEAKDVAVSKGVFNTLLGDTAPLDPADFGVDLWLGISVGADPQMTPRQRLAYVPYAAFASDADTLDGHDASAFAPASAPRPAAYGKVSSNGTLRAGAYNVASVTWDAASERYAITLSGGVCYSIDDVTVATIAGDAGSCPAGAVVRQTSIGCSLLIYIVQSDGANRQCSFDFISYAGR